MAEKDQELAGDKSISRIETLIQEGKQFSYENFSTKSSRGYPQSLTAQWIAWQARVRNLLRSIAGDDSAPVEMLNAGLELRLIGNGRDKFESCKSYFLGALEASRDIIAHDEFGELTSNNKAFAPGRSNRVFVVHGHDDKTKAELEILLSELGLEPVVLHRQPDEGHTIIEKFEKYSDVGYAFIMLTPDEVAYLSNEDRLPDAERHKEIRARPNVIFEFGYFVGKLGRQNVCCLYTGDVSLPSDLNGLLYKKFSANVEEVAYSISRELKARGYRLN